MKFFLPLLAAAFLATFYFCCSSNDSGNPLNSNQTGSLLINFSMNNAELLAPDTDMKPASYNILGTGPNGSSLSITTSDNSAVFDNLILGTWNIDVIAKNADGTIIAEGQGSTIIYVGKTSNVTITVMPIKGKGTINLTVNWKASDTKQPAIIAQLISSSGTPIDLTFQISNGNTGTYVNNSIPTGYYTLVLKLMDNGYITMGAVEVVRIINEETTLGVYNFTEINTQTGKIIVNIFQQMNNPFTVTMAGLGNSLFTNKKTALSASVPDEVGEVVYVWYINGESKGTGSTYILNGLNEGIYRVDVTAFSADGSRAGSATNTSRVILNSQETPINLGTSDNFALLAKSGVTVGAAARITGNIGMSPYLSYSLLGLTLSMDSSGTFSTCTAQVKGKIYAPNYSGTTPAMVKKAVEDMVSGFHDAAARITPASIDIGGGELGGKSFGPGIYKWNTAVSITTDITLSGASNDVWIFQINGALSIPAAVKVHLTGGARAENIFWQTGGAVSIGAAAHLDGVILSSGTISLGAGASVNGRLLGQNSVILGAGSTLIQPEQ